LLDHISAGQPTFARQISLCHLDASAIDALWELEKTSWPSELRASKEIMQQRFDLGHGCWAAVSGNNLVAAGNYVYTDINPLAEASFPKSFTAFFRTPQSGPILTSFVYNLCVRPDWRGSPAVFRVMDALVSQARLAGARYLVGNARCPSFNGSVSEGPERIAMRPAVRAIIEQWHRTGQRPDDRRLGRDPLLKFYKRALACDFTYLMPEFLPGDTASGGYGVIFTKMLDDNVA